MDMGKKRNHVNAGTRIERKDVFPSFKSLISLGSSTVTLQTKGKIHREIPDFKTYDRLMRWFIIGSIREAYSRFYGNNIEHSPENLPPHFIDISTIPILVEIH